MSRPERELEPGRSALDRFGYELRRLRKQCGLSQGRLGLAVHVSGDLIQRIEVGARHPSRDLAERCDAVLCAEGRLITAWDAVQAERLEAPEDDLALPERVTIPHLGPFRLVPFGNGALPDLDAAAMQAFRVADVQVGGGNLYPSVINYLNSAVAPRLFGSDGGQSSARKAFEAAAALTEMAGWMAHDAGADTVAGRHFERGLAFAEASRDGQLHAHVLGSMSHLAGHLNQPDEAIAYAQRGQVILSSGPASPGLRARLLALEARGLAIKADAGKCGEFLFRAEGALGERQPDALSPWVSSFDEGSLASEAARCMHHLGNFPEARRQAARVITLRPGNRARSRAFGQLTLASVLLRTGELDEACAVARQAIDSTKALGSYLVIRQLVNLQPLLAPYRTTGAVAEFLSCLNEALAERQWLYRWLRDGIA